MFHQNRVLTYRKPETAALSDAHMEYIYEESKSTPPFFFFFSTSFSEAVVSWLNLEVSGIKDVTEATRHNAGTAYHPMGCLQQTVTPASDTHQPY